MDKEKRGELVKMTVAIVLVLLMVAVVYYQFVWMPAHSKKKAAAPAAPAGPPGAAPPAAPAPGQAAPSGAPASAKASPPGPKASVEDRFAASPYFRTSSVEGLTNPFIPLISTESPSSNLLGTPGGGGQTGLLGLLSGGKAGGAAPGIRTPGGLPSTASPEPTIELIATSVSSSALAVVRFNDTPMRVRPGDILGDYRVVAIDLRQLVLAELKGKGTRTVVMTKHSPYVPAALNQQPGEAIEKPKTDTH